MRKAKTVPHRGTRLLSRTPSATKGVPGSRYIESSALVAALLLSRLPKPAAPFFAHAGRPFPVEPIRTLDAIHLATAAALSAMPALVTIVTRDLRVRNNATALGHQVE